MVGASKLNSGLFDALLESRVQATFCGHDHFNDAVMRRRGLWLCYGRVGSCTPPSNWEGDGGDLPFPVGARVIQLTAGVGAGKSGGRGGGGGVGATASTATPAASASASVMGRPLLETWVEEEAGEVPGSRIELTYAREPAAASSLQMVSSAQGQAAAVGFAVVAAVSR